MEAALITLLVFGLIAGTALAKGTGKGNRDALPCEVTGNTVSAGGLPTDEVINFMITDAAGKRGWALGISGGDYWSVQVPDRAGPTTYEFVSRTFGNNGERYRVFATCSASCRARA